jgi:penicillin-binding protein 1C
MGDEQGELPQPVGQRPAAPQRRRWRRWLALGLGGAVLCLGAGAAGGYWLVQNIIAELPPTPMLSAMPVSTEVVDRKGALLRAFTTADGRWRLPVGRADVDRRFIAMLIAYEDQNFGTGDAVDWRALLRAGLQFVGAGGHIVSGGSTLTMQVARLIEGGSTHDLAAKLRQIVHAEVLGRTLSPAQVLDLYLTMAPYGGNIEGVRAASLAYFGKEPARLTTAEAALLVALPQSPEARRPDLHPEAARAGRDRVLDRMVSEDVITAEAAAAAKREPIPRRRRNFPMLAPQLARQAVDTRPRARVIHLTIDGGLEASLEALARERATMLGPKLSVAIIAADATTGDILASVGSADLLDADRAGFVDMTRVERSPGSTLKPLIYGLAFELGLAHPESLIEDRPTDFSGYVPDNFDGTTRGTVTMREALQQSLNIPAIIVLDAVGTARLVSRLHRADVDPVLPAGAAPGLAMGLGGVGVTLRDLVSLYASIARGGAPVHLRDGVTPAPPTSPAAAPVLAPAAAWYVADILRGVPPPPNGAPGRISYKTGTSYGGRDAWSVGFDGRTVIGVWVGRADGAPVPGLTGLIAAAPILFSSFDRMGLKAVPLPPPPPGVLFASNAELPSPLRRFRNPDTEMVARDPAPEIAYPANGVDVDLGIAGGGGQPLVVKVRNGDPPFTFFANGAPFDQSAFDRQASWTPDGPGYVTLSVLDAKGRSASVKVFVD